MCVCVYISSVAILAQGSEAALLKSSPREGGATGLVVAVCPPPLPRETAEASTVRRASTMPGRHGSAAPARGSPQTPGSRAWSVAGDARKQRVNKLVGPGLLAGPTGPQWGCTCGAENWACRTCCRVCGRAAARAIVIRAEQASKRLADGADGGGARQTPRGPPAGTRPGAPRAVPALPAPPGGAAQPLAQQPGEASILQLQAAIEALQSVGVDASNPELKKLEARVSAARLAKKTAKPAWAVTRDLTDKIAKRRRAADGHRARQKQHTEEAIKLWQAAKDAAQAATDADAEVAVLETQLARARLAAFEQAAADATAGADQPWLPPAAQALRGVHMPEADMRALEESVEKFRLLHETYGAKPPVAAPGEQGDADGDDNQMGVGGLPAVPEDPSGEGNGGSPDPGATPASGAAAATQPATATQLAGAQRDPAVVRPRGGGDRERHQVHAHGVAAPRPRRPSRSCRRTSRPGTQPRTGSPRAKGTSSVYKSCALTRRNFGPCRGA